MIAGRGGTPGLPSVAGYPVRPVALQFGQLRLEVLVIDRLADYVDAGALLRDADVPEPPYWAHLWVGSLALARLVATEIDCAGRRVVDVGCGLGLAGIAAAARGAVVTSLDLTRDALRLVLANAQRNRCQVEALQADLRRPGLRGRFDVCLAADVTYDPALQSALAGFLAEHLERGGQAWCAESVRTADPGFAHACDACGLRTHERQVREVDEGRDAFVRVTEVEWV